MGGGQGWDVSDRQRGTEGGGQRVRGCRGRAGGPTRVLRIRYSRSAPMAPWPHGPSLSAPMAPWPLPCSRPVNLKILNRAPFFQNGAKSGFEMCFGPSTLGAGAKTRLESRIKKFTPHCVCRPSMLGMHSRDHNSIALNPVDYFSSQRLVGRGIDCTARACQKKEKHNMNEGVV